MEEVGKSQKVFTNWSIKKERDQYRVHFLRRQTNRSVRSEDHILDSTFKTYVPQCHMFSKATVHEWLKSKPISLNSVLLTVGCRQQCNQFWTLLTAAYLDVTAVTSLVCTLFWEELILFLRTLLRIIYEKEGYPSFFSETIISSPNH